MKLFTSLILYFIFILTTFTVYSEKIIVGAVKMINIDSAPAEGLQCEMGCTDAAAIFFTNEHLFLQGIEIEIKQDSCILKYPNTIAYSFYKSITPMPSEQKKTYKGSSLIKEPLAPRVSSVFQIPVIASHALKESPYFKLINKPHTQKDGPVIFRLLPLVKDIPPDLKTAKFILKIKPIFNGLGGLKLNFSYQGEPKPINVCINDSKIQDFDKLIILQSGTHRISVKSDDYRSETRSCIIEQGRIEKVDIKLTSIVPLLFVNAPQEVQIFLDTREITKENFPISIAAGKHTIKFKLGDYEIVRSIKAEEGKTYSISFLLDVILQEEN